MIDISRGLRWAVVALAAAVLLPVLAACTVNIGGTAASSSAARSTASAPATSQSGGTAVQSAAPGQNNVARVSCSGASCSVTLGGTSRLTVLGTTFSLSGIQDGRATLDVGGRSVSCAQGESVSAGGVTLACTAVTEDSVSFTATRG
jgi:hypothetical protein